MPLFPVHKSLPLLPGLSECHFSHVLVFNEFCERMDTAFWLSVTLPNSRCSLRVYHPSLCEVPQKEHRGVAMDLTVGSPRKKLSAPPCQSDSHTMVLAPLLKAICYLTAVLAHVSRTEMLGSSPFGGTWWDGSGCVGMCVLTSPVPVDLQPHERGYCRARWCPSRPPYHRDQRTECGSHSPREDSPGSV